MSNADLNIQDHKSTDDDSFIDNNTLKVLPMRKVKPLIVASFATLIWLAIAAFIIQQQIDIGEQWTLNTLFSLVGGMILPIVLFWLVALVFQRTDPLLEQRVSMVQNLGTTLAPIDLAEKRMLALNKSIQNQFESIESFAEIATKSMNGLEKRFENQTAQLFAASAEMEVKSRVIRDRLSKERQLFSEISDGVDQKLTNINTTMSQLKSSIKETTETVAVTVDSALDKTRTQTDIALSTSARLSQELTASHSTLEQQSQDVMETCINVEQKLSEVNLALITNTDRLRDDITELDTFATDIVEAMRSEVLLVEEMSEKAQFLTEKIEKSLTQQINHVQSAADAAMERTIDAGDVLNEHAHNIVAMFNKTLENTREAADKTVEDIAQQMSLSKKQTLDNFSEITMGSKDLAKDILASSHEVTNLLDGTLARARLALTEIGEQLVQHGDKAEVSAKIAADDAINTLESLHKRLNSSLSIFTETIEGSNQSLDNQANLLTDHTSLLAKSAEHATEALTIASNNMDAAGVGLGQSLEQNRQTLNELEKDLSAQQNSLSNLSQSLTETVNSAQTIFEGTSEKLRSETDDATSKIAYMSDNLAVTTQNIIEFGKSSEESITQLADKIRTESQHVRVDLDLSTRSFEDASSLIAVERKQLKEQIDDIGTLLRGSSEKLKDRIVDIANAATQAAGTSDSMASDLSGLKLQYETAIQSALTQFHDALEIAEDNSARLSQSLSGEADRIRDEAASFISKTQEIEDRIAKATKDDFLRSSNMLIESLQSTAIDIDKLLESDIPDDIWDKFISGDRSIFARRTVKLATKESKKVIADKFISDSKFRDHVGRFLKDFEGLMERSMHGDKGSAMSVAIISSNMGKLYVLLAQSLKKLQ